MDVACRETLRDAAKVQEDGSDYRLSIRITLDFDPVTPWQKGWVAFHVVDQRIHLRCAVIEQYRFVYDRHLDVNDFDKIAILYKEACAFMTIADNKKAFHDYFIEERFEAGMALEGWEVKSIRAGRVQLKEAYVIVRAGEIFLFGAHISPLPTASTHVKPDPVRDRKLLMHASEINKLIGKVERAGYTLVPLNLHFSKGRIKCEIGLAKGKKQYDKRETEKARDWQREQQQIMKQNRR